MRGLVMKLRNKLVRISKVLSMFFVIFLQIYWYKFRRKPKDEWENLWGKIGERFRKKLFELEGLLIKIGQILSTRGDLLPKAFIRQIEDLTDKVPPSNWSDIQEILEAEWGKSLNQHFLSIIGSCFYCTKFSHQQSQLTMQKGQGYLSGI